MFSHAFSDNSVQLSVKTMKQYTPNDFQYVSQ